MSGPVIYHGTPLTPRAALKAILPGRAACVSFWRPDDAEAVQAVCPAIMFRQRRVLGMDEGAEARGTLVHSRRLDTLLRMAGTAAVHAGAVGGDSRRTRRAVPAQRRAAPAMAVRSVKGRAALAHGRADRAAAAPMRALRSGLPGLDGHGRGRGCRLRSLVATHGRDRAAPRQSLAGAAPHARRAGRAGIPLWQRGREQRRAERITL